MVSILPPCTGACPVNTDVRGYLAAIARRDYIEAYRLISDNNPFPSVCAWVCPHPCEDSCRRGTVDSPLAIRDLKRFAVESAGKVAPEVTVSPGTGRRVAVVGAGPAGLTAAYDLVRLGHRVVVYDRHPEPGGHLFASLPVYRLPREALRRDIDGILGAGVELRAGVEVGRDITVEGLRSEYDAVILGVGLWAGRGLKLPGFDHPGVLSALPFLKMANSGEKLPMGTRAVVIGGGDVAMDVARTALRLGVSGVVATCLESREEMPAHSWEVEDALAEGVELLPGYGPVEITLESGAITGLRVQKVKSVFDREGKFNPTFHPIFLNIPGDTVILSIGQAPDQSFMEGSGLEKDSRGCPAVDKKGLLAGDGVFVCGEIATGPGPAIGAVASGHRIAGAVNRYLSGRGFDWPAEKHEVIGPLPSEVARRVPRRIRQEMPVKPPHMRRADFLPYELGFSEESALCEAGRCLSCGLGAEVMGEKCSSCLTCLRVCPYGVPVMEGRAGISAEGCQACGICAAACPALAITMGLLDEKTVDRLLCFDGLSDHQPALAVFTCRGSCGGIDMVTLKTAPGLERAVVVELPTAGALRLEWILKAFERGAAGVAVIACGEGLCRHGAGGETMQGVVAGAVKILDSIGIPADRFFYCRPSGEEDPMVLLSNFLKKLLIYP